MSETGAEPTIPQDHGPGDEAPPFDNPVFPAQQRRHTGPQQVPNKPPLIRPPPGGLTQSPEELTRQIGWTALTEAVTKSATALSKRPTGCCHHCREHITAIHGRLYTRRETSVFSY